MHYSFKYKSLDQPEVETRYGTWESPVEGTINFWNISTGDEVSKNYGPVLVVTEPCKHGLQIAGMCANCGKDMTEVDYLSNAASERAKIKMDHSGEGPLMSVEEAVRIERENTDHLLRNRKLSLIVDLDQTILHATVDPTVGEWMKAKQSSESGSTTPPLESANWPALDDVVQFQLGDDHHGSSIPHPSSPWYYIKPRPGLTRFMNDLSRLYEMHVYTMGTRSYANAVCAALDPTGKWFSSRILTRSESGSDRFKNLKRLFPSDQSMVAIIDDRADVWDWSPNLVKVIAFDFFVGTGDINSSFLPKLKPDVPNLPAVVPPEKGAEHVQPGIPVDSSAKVDEIAKRQEEQALDVAKQLEERPLAKAQENVQEKSDGSDDSSAGKVQGKSGDDLHERIRKAVLNDDDRELDRVETILVEAHRKFYEMHDARVKNRSNPIPDISRIIPSRRAKTFGGVHMVFSGVFPLSSRPDSTDVWRTAVAFGATCHLDINPKVTHLVVVKPGTVKADKAFERGGIHVVYLPWFHESVAKWERQPEANYLVPRRHHRRPDADASLSSTDKGSKQHAATSTSIQSTTTGPKLDGDNATELKVSVPDGIGENGADSRASATEELETATREEMEAATDDVEEPNSTAENNEMDLNGVDWDAIDKEVADALASDDDDSDSIAGSEGTNGETRNMEDVLQTTRGVKRRRSETSAPSTPSKLRFSTTFSREEDSQSPSGKRQKTSDTVENEEVMDSQVSIPEEKASGLDLQEGGDDDDDDFLAREMAQGGDTDDSDDSDDSDSS